MTPAAAGAILATVLVFRLARKHARAQEALERSQLVQNSIAKEISVPFQSTLTLGLGQRVTNSRSPTISISRPPRSRISRAYEPDEHCPQSDKSALLHIARSEAGFDPRNPWR